MINLLRKLTPFLFEKPPKCPACGCKFFHWDHGGPNGVDYWKCNQCGYMIKG